MLFRSTTKPYIFGRRPEVRTHITASVDLNQNVFAKNTESEAYLAFLNRARVVHLSYSYRIPREAGTLARDLLKRSDVGGQTTEPPVATTLRQLSRMMSFGFASEFIAVYTYSDLSVAVRHAMKKMDELAVIWNEEHWSRVLRQCD